VRPLGRLQRGLSVGFVAFAILEILRQFVLPIAWGTHERIARAGDAVLVINPGPAPLLFRVATAVLALASAVLVVVLAVSFLRWLHRVAVQVRAHGATGLRLSPDARVWWWFVPVAWFWMPYRAVRELWHAAGTGSHGEEVRHAKGSPLLLAWWTLGVIAGLLAVTSVVVGAATETADPRSLSSALRSTAELLIIPECFLTRAVVRRMTARVESRTPAPA